MSRAALELPGLVVAHTHLYSTLARGMPPPAVAPRSFGEILEKIWWRLDRALDLETIRISARVGIAEAIRAGATCIIDHHESPNAIEGSLEVIADEMEAAGVRGVLCYGITARNRGEAEWRAGLAENERFLRQNRRARVKGLVGVHACFTVPDAALEAAAALARAHGTGLHVHVAEDAVDRDAFIRLSKADALVPKSVYAHAVHLSPEETRSLAQHGWLVQNVRSNMGNRVGYARLSPAGDRVCLGTDGWDGDVLAESRALVARAAEAGEGIDLLARLESGRELARALLGSTEGDRVVLEYDPPTPLDDLGAHLASTAPRVREVFVAGRRLEPRYDASDAQQAAVRLWRRMEAL